LEYQITTFLTNQHMPCICRNNTWS